MREIVIAGAVRTAIGSFGGTLGEVAAVELGARVIGEALSRAAVDIADVDEVIMGQVLQAGCGANPARQAALKAGLAVNVPAYTVNKVCASGMKAVTLGAAAIALGERDVVVAGGMESMSSAPFLLGKARWGYRLGDGELLDGVLRDALTDPGEGCHMGITVEVLAEEFTIGRSEQDAYAARSQQRAEAAIGAGKFRAEITPVEIPQRKGAPVVFDTDEFPRPGTTVEVLAKLKPAFKKDGSATAGNASGINDGAAAVVLMASEEAERRGLRPMARIISYASAALEPMRMGLGPVPATESALAKAGLSLDDIGLVELNEAFAVQTLAVMRQLRLEPDTVNVNGGAIALGHPVGASGARILVTLLHAMRDRNAKRGLATLCVGGGQGMAVVVESCS